MATKKKLLQAAAGQAGGGDVLNVEDVFSTYLYEGTSAPQSIINGIKLGGDTGGAISLQAQADGLEIPQSSDFDFGTGDFTCEAWIYLEGTNSTYRTMLGFDTTGGLLFEVHTMKLDFGVRGTSSDYSTSTLSADQWNHVAIVRSSGTSYWFINGTLDKTDASVHSSTDFSNATAALIGDYQKNTTNFDGSISNLRVSNVARYTSSFTPSTTPLASDANTVLLIGQNPDPFVDNSSSSHSVSSYGSPAKSGVGPFTASEAGEGGLVWSKSRSNARVNRLIDTERGVTKTLRSDATLSEETYTDTLTSFNSNGFTLGADASSDSFNRSSDTYATWTFRKAPKFFDVVTYTGDGNASQTISHSLGTTVGMLIIKKTSGTGNWGVYHRGLGNNKSLELETSGAAYNNVPWGSVTSTTFEARSDIVGNDSGATYVAYLFAHNDGDGDFGGEADADIIKCGSWTGSGSSGTQVELGFEPQWVMVKQISGSSESGWMIFDVMRDMNQETNTRLLANETSVEGSYTSGNVPIALNATGFKVKQSYFYDSGNAFIYMAIRRGTKVPESATEVFAIDAVNSSEPYFTSGFPIDMAFYKSTSGSSGYVSSRLTGLTEGELDTTAAFGSATAVGYDKMTGFVDAAGNPGANYYAWMWKRAPGYFDVVAEPIASYQMSGPASSSYNPAHNLGVTPEMIWVKDRDNTDNWYVYHSALGTSKKLSLSSTDAETSSSWAVASDNFNFYLFGNATGNAICYLFASLDGISKVGSYTGTGGYVLADCGFTTGARFVLIKRTDASGDWYVWDTERGITSGNDPYLLLNSTSAEVTNTDWIATDSRGFYVSFNAPDALNASGGEYIFYAIA